MSGSSSGDVSSEAGSRNQTLIFEECHARVQTVAELLLISCRPRPVFTSAADVAMTHDNFEGFRDKVIGQLNKMLLLSREVATQAHSKQIHWRQLSQRVRELTAVVVALLELSAHISYLMAVRCGEGQAVATLATLGPVDSAHRLTQADLDIRFSCQRLKRSRVNDLQPHLLVREKCLSVSISSAIIQMFRAVRDLVHAASSSKRHQDRLSLCVESLTRSASQLRDMLLSHSFVPAPAVMPSPPHSSPSHVPGNSIHVPDCSRSLSGSEKDGDSSAGSLSCSSWEKFDGKTGYLPLELGEGDRHTSQSQSHDRKKEKPGRLSMSPQGSPKLSPREGQTGGKQDR
ncbi:hypothetical protein EGW08_009406, partial [Elysia chlorotica]